MRDPHLHIVGHDRQVIRRVAVGAEDDEVLDVRVVELDRPVHEIVDPHVPSGTLKRTARGLPALLARGDLVRRSGGSSVAIVPPAARLPPPLRACAFSSSGVQ